jgi:hypothetical protein
MGPRALGALGVGALLLGALVASCGGSNADLEAAREFDDYPLLWAGEEFEGLPVTHVELGPGGATFIYGDCEPKGDDEPSCTTPLQLQVFPLCANLAAVARAPIWKRRSIRGAPVGTIDSAPVLFSRRVQVKAYRGEGSDPGLAWRALVALRSANQIPPIVDSTGPIPAPDAAVLAGTRPCAA